MLQLMLRQPPVRSKYRDWRVDDTADLWRGSGQSQNYETTPAGGKRGAVTAVSDRSGTSSPCASLADAIPANLLQLGD